MSWGIVATVKAPTQKLLAFLAWHLDLGAAAITLCFDEPFDPARTEIAALGLSRVRLIACDDAYWQRLGGRPERHQNRQAKNARLVYREASVDWLLHADADEFLLAEIPPDEVLASLPDDQILCRAEPYEALHDPDLPDDIYTARHFRAALKPRFAALRAPVLDEFAEILTEGMLSHSAGKAFFRTGIKGLSPRLHGAFLGGERLPGPGFDPRLRLLHFHAEDRAAWRNALEFRLTRGAYQYQPALQAWLSAADDEGIERFYQVTQQPGPEARALLHEAGRLVEARLDLRTRVQAMLCDKSGSE